MQDRQQPKNSASGNIAATWQDRLATAPVALAVLPGLMLCIAVTALASLLQAWEEAAFGHPYVEALVIAILLGIALRSVWQPSEIWQAGISFSARTLLETPVVLLGTSRSPGPTVSPRPALHTGIFATVIAALAAIY